MTKAQEYRIGLDQLHPSWQVALADQRSKLAALELFLNREEDAGRHILPEPSRVLRVFQQPIDSVKVLIVGQDPYPTKGHPVGLSFSTDPELEKLPRSLKNIYAELERDLKIPAAETGDLSAWERQGVMLLNRVLTVQQGVAGSHRRYGWEGFTEAAIKALVKRGGGLVAILWGSDARSLAPLLQGVPIIQSAHPSPLSAARGFIGSKPFSHANLLLEEQGVAPIDWRVV